MRLILKVLQGGTAGEEIVLAPGDTARIGGDAQWSDYSFGDAALSAVHFVIVCDEVQSEIRDLNTRTGTSVNGSRVSTAKLNAGDRISAGQIVLQVEIDLEEETAAEQTKADDSEGSRISPAIQRLLTGIRQLPHPLFLLVDCARDPLALEILGKHGADAHTLFQGQDLGTLIPVSPHLVAVDKQSKLLEELLVEGWGKAWFVFVIAQADFGGLREHLRGFLMCEDEDGRDLYFRFYDPRVLRRFLPTCTQTEAHRFFGPVLQYWTEDEKPEFLLQFSPSARGVQRQPFALVEGASA